jgi:hypothetical protein
MMKILLTGVAAAALTMSMAFAASASGKKTKIAPEPPPPPPPAAAWLDTLTINGFLSGGVVINPSQPFNKINFGHLFTDRANTPQFNQGILTVARPLDPKATDFDFGFKMQWMLGTDARYSHYLGVLDYAIHDRTQIAPIEAHVMAHLPLVTPLSQGGIDVKVGKFVTLNGAEVIPADGNIFYSHSYMFNFGPFLHTGVVVNTHVTSWLDVMAGVTTGVNTSIGWPGDNNASASFHGGFGLNLLDGNLTIMAMTHSGPENPKQLDPYGVGWPNTPLACACNPNSTWRYFNNITTTWKATENLTFITDISYMREDGWIPISVTGLPADTIAALDDNFGTNLAALGNRPQGADAYGIAQYASYKVNDLLKLSTRIEYFRDNKNFFVAGFPFYFDAVNAGHGFPTTAVFQPANVGTSYLAVTAGATITPEVPKNPFITGLILRPEVRWDIAVNNAAPFFGPVGRRRSAGLFAMDVIVPFSIR